MDSPEQPTVIVSCVCVVVATIVVTPLPSRCAEVISGEEKGKNVKYLYWRTDAWEDLGAVPADAVLLSVHDHVRAHAWFHQRPSRVVVGIQWGRPEVLVVQIGQAFMGQLGWLKCHVGLFQLPI